MLACVRVCVCHLAAIDPISGRSGQVKHSPAVRERDRETESDVFIETDCPDVTPVCLPSLSEHRQATSAIMSKCLVCVCERECLYVCLFIILFFFAVPALTCLDVSVQWCDQHFHSLSITAHQECSIHLCFSSRSHLVSFLFINGWIWLWTTLMLQDCHCFRLGLCN